MANNLCEMGFNDYSDEVLNKMHEAVMRALVRCGQQAHGYAVDLTPVNTGNLRNSIAFRVDPDELSMYLGSASDYAAYVELGTGKYYTGGRPTPWVYQDEQGNWHWTAGNPAQPFIKPAIADHMDTYKNIIKDELKNG